MTDLSMLMAGGTDLGKDLASRFNVSLNFGDMHQRLQDTLPIRIGESSPHGQQCLGPVAKICIRE